MSAPARLRQREKLIMFVPDIADECLVSDATARRWLSSGKFGAILHVGKRSGVSRERFLAWIKKTETPFRGESTS